MQLHLGDAKVASEALKSGEKSHVSAITVLTVPSAPFGDFEPGQWTLRGWSMVGRVGPDNGAVQNCNFILRNDEARSRDDCTRARRRPMMRDRNRTTSTKFINQLFLARSQMLGPIDWEGSKRTTKSLPCIATFRHRIGGIGLPFRNGFH